MLEGRLAKRLDAAQDSFSLRGEPNDGQVRQNLLQFFNHRTCQSGWRSGANVFALERKLFACFAAIKSALRDEELHDVGSACSS